MKKVAIILMVIMSIAIFVGCGGNGGISGEPKINIDDVEYNVKEDVVDGRRVPTFEFTNNTKYDIAYIKLDYKVKDGVTEDELSSNSTISEKATNMEHPLMDTTVNVNTNKYVESGTNISRVRLYLDATIEYLSDYSVMDYMTPDILTLSYISGNNIYTAYYDYDKKEMSYDDNVKDKKSWPDNEMSNLISKPESDVYITRSDLDDYIWVVALNSSKEDYEAYINQCKEKGFSNNVDNTSYSNITKYEATNQDGVELSVTFDSSENTLSITLNK